MTKTNITAAVLASLLVTTAALAAPPSGAAQRAWINTRAARIQELSAQFKACQQKELALNGAYVLGRSGKLQWLLGLSYTPAKADIRVGGKQYSQKVYTTGVHLGPTVGADYGETASIYKAAPGTPPDKIIPVVDPRAAEAIGLGVTLDLQAGWTPGRTVLGASAYVGPSLSLPHPFFPVAGQVRVNVKQPLGVARTSRALALARAGANLAERALAAHNAGNYGFSERAIQRMEKALNIIERDYNKFVDPVDTL